MKVDKVLAIAKAEVGYLEKRNNSNLDSKTANAGTANYTKYARDLDAIGFYNGRKNGYAWCDVFVDWCFVQAYGAENAKKLLCQPELNEPPKMVYRSTQQTKKELFSLNNRRVLFCTYRPLY